MRIFTMDKALRIICQDNTMPMGRHQSVGQQFAVRDEGGFGQAIESDGKVPVIPEQDFLVR